MCWICLVVDRQPRCAGSILCWTDGRQRDAGRPWIRPWTAAPPVRQWPAWLCRQRRRRYLHTPHQDAPRGSAACARRNGEPARRCAGHTVARHRGREKEKGTSTPGQRWGGRTVPAGGGARPPPHPTSPRGVCWRGPARPATPGWAGPLRPFRRARCRPAASPPHRQSQERAPLALGEPSSAGPPGGALHRRCAPSCTLARPPALSPCRAASPRACCLRPPPSHRWMQA